MKYLVLLAILLSPCSSFSQHFYKLLYEAESKTRTGDFDAALQLYQQASSISNLSPESLYNLSCLYGKMNDTSQALAYLSKAVDAGFGNSDYIKMEPALRALHQQTKWSSLLAKADKNDEALLMKLSQQEEAERYSLDRIFTPGELHEDLQFLKNAMQEAHPGLTWYTTQHSLDSAWQVLNKLCSKPQTVTSFYYNLWRTVNLVRDVHSETTLPKAINQQFYKQPFFFPIPVKFFNHHCYVNLKQGTNYPFKFGDEILALDGHSAAEIENRLQQLVVADGYTTTGKQRIVNRLFYKLYPLAFGTKQQVAVRYRTAGYKVATALGNNLAKSAVDSVYQFRYPELNDSVPGRYFYKAGIPVLKLNTFGLINFSAAGIDFYHFIDSAFNDVQAKGAKSLVIDLRQTNGGDEQLLQEMLGYLLDKPWQPYQTAFVKTREFSFLPQSDNWLTGAADRIKIEFQQDSTGAYTRNPDWANFATIKPNQFQGKVIVLIGGLDVSAGSSFPSLLYYNKPETIFIGEETGGGFYGNNSSYYLVVTLPHTKIHYKIPLVQLHLNVSGMPFGRGLQPKYFVQETLNDLKEGNDAAMNKAIELASESNQ